MGALQITLIKHWRTHFNGHVQIVEIELKARLYSHFYERISNQNTLITYIVYFGIEIYMNVFFIKIDLFHLW